MAAIRNLRIILFAFFVSFGSFSLGYAFSVISGCLIMPDFQRRFGTCDSSGQNCVLDSSRQSIITSLLLAGNLVGALGQAFTSDRFGSIFIWTSIFVIGAAIQTGSIHSIAQISTGRFIAGVGVGALSAIVPLYNGELAPKAIRGTILALIQLQVMAGIFTSYCIELVTHTINNSASWRIPVGIQMLWGLIICSGIFFLPESPRHLIGIGKHDKARQVVATMNNTSVDDPIVNDAMEELEIGIKAENEGGKSSWMECFSTRNMLWKRTMNVIVLQCIQQLNGQNFYYFYGDTFFLSAGSTMSPFVIQTILGAVSVAGTIPALHLIESWGRRKSLLIGAVLEAVCALVGGLVGHYMLAPAGTSIALLTKGNKQGGYVLIAFAFLHVFAFNLCWGPTPWVHLGESFPLRVRPKGIALGGATNFLWNFLLSFFAPKIANQIGPLILLIFFCMLVVGWVYVFFFVPETKGLSLEEVDEIYRADIKPWRSASWKPQLYDERNQQHMAEVSGSAVKEKSESDEA